MGKGGADIFGFGMFSLLLRHPGGKVVENNSTTGVYRLMGMASQARLVKAGQMLDSFLRLLNRMVGLRLNESNLLRISSSYPNDKLRHRGWDIYDYERTEGDSSGTLHTNRKRIGVCSDLSGVSGNRLSCNWRRFISLPLLLLQGRIDSNSWFHGTDWKSKKLGPLR
ncbi:hypothetical protein CDAR_506141 [Caerostris darwini]|uniref:Uncharacterized protein n=1 Tax=Caerostris darwini TaxID=1538125 RepID=A0AAV4WHJ9_9ARAC|nr:hypothetical protein CDAR_506141 [Caerostris darwini]